MICILLGRHIPSLVDGVRSTQRADPHVILDKTVFACRLDDGTRSASLSPPPQSEAILVFSLGYTDTKHIPDASTRIWRGVGLARQDP